MVAEERDSCDSRGEDHDLVVWTPAQQKALADMGFEGELLVAGPREDQTQINPLYLARIAELLSFDGDVPILRTGPLPEDGTPAVPVLTGSVDPVVIGQQLRRASEEVGQSLRLAQDHLNNAAVEESESKSLVPGAASILGYGPGQQPFPRVALELSPLASPDFSERQRLAWSVLATSQGRETLARLLERKLAKALSCEIGVHSGEFAHAKWVQKLDEASQVSPKFNIVDTIMGSLQRQLANVKCAAVIVEPLHTVYLRRIGFTCRASIAAP